MRTSPASPPSDQFILEQLRANHPDGFTFLYAHCYPALERYVCHHQGTAGEADDVFQDTLLILLTNIRKPDFELTASLSTYLFSVGKHLWLKHLKLKMRYISVDPDELTETAEPLPTAAPAVFEVLEAVLSTITRRCLALLTALFFQQKSIDTVVGGTGYANRHTAQNQKYKCLEQARRYGRDLLRQAHD